MRPAFNLRALSVGELTRRVVGMREVDPRLLRALGRDPRQGVRRLAARLRASEARAASEAARLEGLFAVEREHQAHGFAVIAGVDEVGVAPLAGPVVAAAVVLPAGISLPHLDDSKRLTPEQRDALYPQITACAAASIGMATVRSEERRVGKECRYRWAP